ncbi:ribosome-binding factor A [bacterium BMS3Bbin11]|nr:ribosome-binding factor A [bacterium BMS3Abin11]GBE45377.1 ribosome-binding factor A [bacterium BMS3Bbin11]HDH14962.1 30S ribosome-binding factor RbfA [Gammaproteobacteria bacterium]
MPRDFSRSARVSEVIQREVANIVQKGMNDPRAAAVTITHTRMTRDMSSAQIYFVMQGEKQTIKETEKVLNKAASFIRHELAGCIELRYIPKLHFAYDHSIERGLRVGKLIDDLMLNEQDKNKE